MGRTSYHHGDLRAALIAGAVELVREQGLEGWTLRGVARKVGVSHAAPYHHFKDVEGLLGAVTALGFDRMTEALSAAAGAAPPEPRARLAALGRAYLAFGAANPGLYQVMFREVRSEDQGSPEGRDAGSRTLHLFVAEAADALPDAPDPIAVVLPAWATLHGFVSLAVLGPLPRMGLVEAPEEQIRESMVEAALRTMGL
ncbi:MAG: TetR/AcrR family transcriptional regulator [Proteobacteria bacterium]|nr:TetR/AcrR family transcriptional regulator [Pseudomonadota bacterium]